VTAGLVRRSATELLALMQAGDVSAVEVAQAHLDRIHATDERLHAWLRTHDDTALAQAEEIDRRRAAGEAVGILAGVPYALKDILATKGLETTCASRILEGWKPPYDATVVRRLADADAVLLGKTNMDEFAMGSSTENSAFGATRNPWDVTRVPGGSSGGSSAAVAAFQAAVGIGTDTGGSIRQPAALCGIVGIKPTYGLVSRYGLVAFASSLDVVGPFARTVTDAARVLQVIAGHDPYDSTSVPEETPDYLARLDDGVEGLRIGVLTDVGDEEQMAAPGVRAAVDAAARRFEELGAKLVEVSLPHAPYGLAAYYLIAPAECSSNLSRYDGVRYGLRVAGETAEAMMARTRDAGFGDEVKRRIMIGAYALSAGYYDAYYAQAQRVRTLIIEDYEQAFERCDVVIGPTTPTVAFALGSRQDPLQMYVSDEYTVLSNLSGQPAMSVPVGFDDGLPVGLHLMAPTLGEATMLRVARAIEADVGFDPTPHGPNALDAGEAGTA
jgi:aspartyl-tRNA(Asn)/glutamyl-tRNA(Gln) amidotransferase subunit A